MKMTGWKTKLAMILSVVYGIGGWLSGLHGMDQMMQFVITGLGLVGVGHKIEKAGEAYETAKKQTLDDLVRDHQSD